LVDVAGVGEDDGFVELELLFAADGEALGVAAGELLLVGAGVADFSVATDTVGSVGLDSGLAGADTSGVATGAGLVSSCAQATGAAVTNNAVRARIAGFIGKLPFLI
jgi:hypothetical protein